MGLLLVLSILVSTWCSHSVRELHPSAHDSLRAADRRIGALVTLWPSTSNSTWYAFVGIHHAGGHRQKNAIMMIDFAIRGLSEGRQNPPPRLIYQACLSRFRPIMMTTFAALMGSLAIALSSARAGRAPSARTRGRGGLCCPVPDPLHHARDLPLL